MFIQPHLNTWGGGGVLAEFSEVMQTLDCVLGLHNCLGFSHSPITTPPPPTHVKIRLRKHRKSPLLLKQCFFTERIVYHSCIDGSLFLICSHCIITMQWMLCYAFFFTYFSCINACHLLTVHFRSPATVMRKSCINT